MKRMLPLALAILGVVAVAAAVVRGEASVGLLLVVPVVWGSGGLLGLGVLLLAASAFAWFSTRAAPSTAEWEAQPDTPQPPPELWAHEAPAEQRGTRTGAVALIGPFPLAWGSDRTALLVSLVLGLTIAVVVLVLMLVARSG
ncbi:MAG TPA: DUF131 domain-containing protein [Candidatus Thermoplasmatota archaeon]|nr:DUF131 domain-containing protein [Candidatus Thermoplasmatota archaeon]